MAKITLTIEGSTIGSATIITEYSKEESDRFVAWLLDHYGTYANDQGIEISRTLEQIVEVYWYAVKTGTESNIHRWEQEEAKRKAVESINPINGIVRRV